MTSNTHFVMAMNGVSSGTVNNGTSLPLWIVLTCGVLFGGVTGTATATGGFSFVAFLVQFSVAASYNITYAPYVSDYSRYLPRDTKPSSIISSVFIGASASPAWLIPLGAWMATYLGTSDALAGINETGNDAVSYLGSVLAIVSTLVLVATMGLNAYSGMLTVVTAIDSLKSVKPTRQLRVVTITVLAVAWLVMSLLLTNATSALNTTLLIMLYLLAPWTAVNLTDYFFVRRGHYAIADLFTPNGIYGAWSWRSLTAFTAGVLAEIPFVDLPIFVGPAAKAMGEVDIAFIIGLLVSGVVYIALTRSLDVSGELALIESRPELADPASVEDIVETVAEEENDRDRHRLGRSGRTRRRHPATALHRARDIRPPAPHRPGAVRRRQHRRGAIRQRSVLSSRCTVRPRTRARGVEVVAAVQSRLGCRALRQSAGRRRRRHRGQSVRHRRRDRHHRFVDHRPATGRGDRLDDRR